MKKYLLDTGVLSAYLLGRPRVVSLVDPWLDRDEVATSMLMYGEVIEYFRSKADYPQLRQELRVLLRGFLLYPLSYAIMEQYAEIRRSLRPPRGPGLIGDIDTLIAATAMHHGLTLVSADSDFQRVPELVLVPVDPSWLKV